MKPLDVAKKMAFMNAIWAILGLLGVFKAGTLWGFVPLLASVAVTLGLMLLANKRLRDE